MHFLTYLSPQILYFRGWVEKEPGDLYRGGLGWVDNCDFGWACESLKLH